MGQVNPRAQRRIQQRLPFFNLDGIARRFQGYIE
jgi:hypothetical protein